MGGCCCTVFYSGKDPDGVEGGSEEARAAFAELVARGADAVRRGARGNVQRDLAAWREARAAAAANAAVGFTSAHERELSAMEDVMQQLATLSESGRLDDATRVVLTTSALDWTLDESRAAFFTAMRLVESDSSIAKRFLQSLQDGIHQHSVATIFSDTSAPKVESGLLELWWTALHRALKEFEAGMDEGERRLSLPRP